MCLLHEINKNNICVYEPLYIEQVSSLQNETYCNETHLKICRKNVDYQFHVTISCDIYFLGGNFTPE